LGCHRHGVARGRTRSRSRTPEPYPPWPNGTCRTDLSGPGPGISRPGRFEISTPPSRRASLHCVELSHCCDERSRPALHQPPTESASSEAGTATLWGRTSVAIAVTLSSGVAVYPTDAATLPNYCRLVLMPQPGDPCPTSWPTPAAAGACSMNTNPKRPTSPETPTWSSRSAQGQLVAGVACPRASG
jgi:hypothetical protein